MEGLPLGLLPVHESQVPIRRRFATDQAFYADANHVYWSDTRLNDADLKTFRTFGNDIPYAADARHVWSGSKRLANLDAESFRVHHNHVFTDKNARTSVHEPYPS